MTVPYKQGQFDGACGFYAIVNAVIHLWPRADANRLFEEITNDLIRRGRLVAVLKGSRRGVLNDALSTAQEWCKSESLPFRIERPFWNGPANSLAEFRNRLSNHFNTYEVQASAIIGYEYADANPDADYAHWTVVHNTTPKLL